MNIGIFTDTYEPQINGVVTSIKASIDFLQRNHNVYVFCPNVKPKVPSTEYVWRFPSVVYPFQKEYRLVWPFNRRLHDIQALNLDLIHIHTPFTMGYVGLRIAKKLGLPVVHTYHTYFEKYLHYFPILPEKWVYKYAKKESQRFCNQCDHIIVPSKEMKTLLSSYDIHPPMTIQPSGIHPYCPTSTEVAKFKARYMDERKKNALFVGRIGVEKNIFFLVDAFRRIQQQYPNIHLTIIGDGPEKKALMALVDQHHLSHSVTFTGYLKKPSVFMAYHAADIMLFPSKTETQGLTVVESCMCGTPVIGIDEMGVKNVIHHNRSGFLTPDSVEMYARAALRLITDSELLDRFSDHARIDGNVFSFDTTGKQLESLYKSMLTSSL